MDVATLCVNCGKEFYVNPHYLKLGKGKFCGRECYAEYRVGKKRGPLKPFEVSTKDCPACGKEFVVGGRGNPAHTAKYCSSKCQMAARGGWGAKAKELTDVDAAYIAGFIDGEGHITLVQRPTGSVAPRLFISNTHQGVIEWLHKTVGAGSAHADSRRNEKHAQRYVVTYNATVAETLLRQIRPYMIVKAKQADLVLEFQEKKEHPAFRADKEAQGKYFLAMKDLNRTGPKQQ